jgi:hypothetical protein
MSAPTMPTVAVSAHLANTDNLHCGGRDITVSSAPAAAVAKLGVATGAEQAPINNLRSSKRVTVFVTIILPITACTGIGAIFADKIA